MFNTVFIVGSDYVYTMGKKIKKEKVIGISTDPYNKINVYNDGSYDITTPTVISNIHVTHTRSNQI